jgi:hypothetical protein
MKKCAKCGRWIAVPRLGTDLSEVCKTCSDAPLPCVQFWFEDDKLILTPTQEGQDYAQYLLDEDGAEYDGVEGIYLNKILTELTETAAWALSRHHHKARLAMGGILFECESDWPVCDFAYGKPVIWQRKTDLSVARNFVKGIVRAMGGNLEDESCLEASVFEGEQRYPDMAEILRRISVCWERATDKNT